MASGSLPASRALAPESGNSVSHIVLGAWIHVVLVGEAACEPRGLEVADTTNNQCQLAHRPGSNRDFFELVERPLVADGARRQRCSNIAKGVFEHLEADLPLGIWKTEYLMLPVKPTCADTKGESAARHMVDGDGHLEQHGRMAKRDWADVHAESDLTRLSGEAGEVRVRIERFGFARGVTEGREVVVGKTERHHAIAFRPLRGVEDRAVITIGL